MGVRAWVGTALLLALAVAGCAPATTTVTVPAKPAPDAQEPPFARWPYQLFSREAAVAIALREWRAFGSTVIYPHVPIAGDPEREEGLWQRVGEYWWLGLPMGSPEQGWTGMHDANGQVFPSDVDGEYAWSAAFIDYVMRMAGAVDKFPYSPNHATYINAAREHALGKLPNVALTAYPPQSYAPQPGDLICMWRAGHPVAYQDLPTAAPFPSHCNIVVGIQPGFLQTIGGNIDNTVGMESIPVGPTGLLTDAGGAVIDPDHPWFVVLQVNYLQ